MCPVFTFSTITGRTEAFAHVCGHALDYHILTKLGEGWNHGMSGRLRGKDASESWLSDKPDPARFQEAFEDLLNSRFYENDADAAAILDLQQSISKARSQQVIDKLNKKSIPTDMLEDKTEMREELKHKDNPYGKIGEVFGGE